MSGLTYSELANWDGSFSVSGSQVGNGNNTREPTAEPPSTTSISRSPKPRSAPTSASIAKKDLAGERGSGSKRPVWSYVPHTSLSAAVANTPPRRDKKEASGMFADDARRSASIPTPQARLDAPEKGRHYSPPARQSQNFKSDSAARYRPGHPVVPGDAPAKRQTTSAAANPEDSRASMSNPKQATTSSPSVRFQTPPSRFMEDMSLLCNPQMTLQQLLDTMAEAAQSSTTSNPVPLRDPLADEDGGSLDADGETDHESAVSVYAVQSASQSSSSSKGIEAATSLFDVRDSTESTAISHGRAPSWERTVKHPTASYSHEFLEAFQEYYVSRSPSLQSDESSPQSRAEIAGPSHHVVPPGYPGPDSESAQPSLLVEQSSSDRRSPSIFQLSPLTSPTASIVSLRPSPAKRRRLNKPYVVIPPLPASVPRSAYKPARTIPALQHGSVETDYAAQLGDVLNQASAANAQYMNYTPSSFARRSERRSVKRDESAVMMSPTKRLPAGKPLASSATVPRKRGRPRGSTNKPKAGPTPAPVPAPIQAPGPASATQAPGPSSEPIEVEEQEQQQQHGPADILEPYFPSSHVDIGELPTPSSRASFLVGFRDYFKERMPMVRRPTGPSASKGKATAVAATAAKPTKTTPPLPRRTQSKQAHNSTVAIVSQPSVATRTATTTPAATHITPVLVRPSPSKSSSSLSAPEPAPLAAYQSPLVPASAAISAPPSQPSPPAAPPAIFSTSQSGITSGLDLLADYGSSDEVSDSNKTRTSDDIPSAPRPPMAQVDSVGLSPETSQQPAGIMQFHHVSQYALSLTGNPAGVADMFAAEKALRDMHQLNVVGFHHNLEGINGMPPELYFAPPDFEMHYENGGGLEMSHPWTPEDHPDVPSHANATIDPSLLGGVLGPSPDLRPLTPSPSPEVGPSRVCESSGAQVRRISPGASSVSRSASGSQHAARTASTTSDDSESDGGEPVSAKRRRVQAQQQQQLPIRLRVEQEEESPKRPRRLTERALAHYYESDHTDEERPLKKAKELGNGKGKGKGKGKSKAKATVKTSASFDDMASFRELAEEPTFCHQCRSKNRREKMRCTVIRDTGDQCGLRYCERCIENRYPEIAFNAYAVRFVCPRCQDACNCTACCARRGETYISARVGKLPPAGSAEALALVAEAEAAGKPTFPPRTARTASAVPAPAPKMDLVGGQYFGVIYGLGGERVGSGFVGEDNRGIVVKNPRSPVRRRPKVVAYVGKPRRHAVPPPRADKAATTVDPAAVQAGVVAAPSLQAAPDANDAASPHSGIPLTGRSNVPAAQGDAAPQRRMYVGDRSVLDKGTYVPLDVLFTRLAVEEESDRSHEWNAPSSDPASAQGDGLPGSDPQPVGSSPARAPSRDDLQWAIALALHAVEVDAVKS
ncbi:hypothetical protein BV20DRAFT_973874 [Pilatotrama ljubarskyi]|nr:hypothetical protein BV20DRAFT_973874 [Pilatotrama ljubarskyi]